MVLRKTTIPVLFDGGLDQKSSDKLIAPGQFALLENGVRRKKGLIQKRNGYSALGKGIISSAGEITDGKRLHKFNNDLVLLNNTNIYSYSDANNEWSDRGFVTSVLADASSVVRNSSTQAMLDMCSYAGLTSFVYEDSRNAGVRLTIVDDTTGSPIVYDRELAQNASRPKVNCTGSHIIVTYYDAGDFNVVAINRLTPETVPAAVTLQSDMVDQPYDLDNFLNGLVFAYNTAGGLKIGYLTAFGELGNTFNGYTTPIVDAGSSAEVALSVVANQSDTRTVINILGVDSSDDVYVLNYDLGLNTPVKQVIENLADVRQITGVVTEGDVLDIFYDIVDSSASADAINAYVKKTTSFYDLATTITIGPIAELKRSVGLASKAFIQNGQTYVVASFDTPLQPTYYALDIDGNVVSRLQTQVGGGLVRGTSGNLKSGLTKVETDSFGTQSFPVQTRNRLRIENDGTTLSGYKGVTRIRLEFDAAEYDGTQLGQNLHIAGGILLAFDGVSATELGFNYYPENITTAQPAGPLTGDYSFRVIYEWVDGRGQIHRSAPSTQINLTLAADEVVLTVPTLRLTSKLDVKIVVYATVAGGATVFYRAAEVANDASVDTLDITVDAVNTNQELLYTVGGTLDNIAPPAAKVAHKHKGRVFLGGLESSNTIVYSREHVTGEGVAFSDFLSLNVDSLGGGVTAMATLDDKLVIFKQDATFVLVGDGPTDNGTLNDFSIPELVSGDIGCIDPRSIARLPDGILFKSEKGIYLLDRGLSFIYVGDRVEDYNNEQVTSAVVIDELNEVRFTTLDGPTLVFNYYFNQWSTFTNYSAISAINAVGTYKHLLPDGTVNSEDSSFDDNGTRIKLAIETGWFNFGTLNSNWYGMNGPLGFQRVYRIGFLGEFYSHHIMKLQLAYDYEKAYTDTIYYATDGNIASNYYGDDATYGDSEVYGGTQGTVLQWRHKPTRQKCGSIKVRVEDIDTVGAESSASFGFISMAFEVGVKSGIERMGSGNTIGNG